MKKPETKAEAKTDVKAEVKPAATEAAKAAIGNEPQFAPSAKVDKAVTK